MVEDDPYRRRAKVVLSKEEMVARLEQEGQAAFEIELPNDIKLKLGEEIKPLNDLTEVTEIPTNKYGFNFENTALYSTNFGIFKFAGKDESLADIIGKSVWSWKNTQRELTLVVSLTNTLSENESLKFCLEAIIENGVMTELTTNSKEKRDYKTSKIAG